MTLSAVDGYGPIPSSAETTLRARGRRARATAPRSGARAGRSVSALYCSARRMSAGGDDRPAVVRERAAPAAASSAISVSSSAELALADRGHEPVGTTASSRARSTSAPSTDAESTTGSVFGMARIAQ